MIVVTRPLRGSEKPGLVPGFSFLHGIPLFWFLAVARRRGRAWDTRGLRLSQGKRQLRRESRLAARAICYRVWEILVLSVSLCAVWRHAQRSRGIR